MKALVRNQHGAGLVIALVLVVMVGVGCPPVSKEGTVNVLFTGDGLAKALLAKAGEVDVADIESFTVTLTKIEFDKAGADDDAEEPEDTTGSKDGSDRVTVFEGEQEVDLIDLQGISMLLSSSEVEAGEYTKIRLSISDPKLVLKSDPETEITGIQLTANGNVFVSESFTVPEGQTSNILLDFGGIHLVQQGNGGYTLTPQLRAEIDVQDAAVANTGVIESVDGAASTMVVTLPNGSATVNFAGAQIFLETDTDTPTGTAANLVPGITVEVQGTVDLEGVITATTIKIQPATP